MGAFEELRMEIKCPHCKNAKRTMWLACLMCGGSDFVDLDYYLGIAERAGTLKAEVSDGRVR